MQKSIINNKSFQQLIAVCSYLVSVLKLVGYDEEFQQQNCERFPSWNETKQAKPRRIEAKKATNKKGSKNQAQRTTTKMKKTRNA